MLNDFAIRKRRYPSLTSLVDIIFLLLLFFMLSSTFSKFTEVEVTATLSGNSVSQEKPQLFITLSENSWRINGVSATVENVQEILEQYRSQTPVKAVLKTDEQTSSQMLIDALEVLRNQQIEAVLVQ